MTHTDGLKNVETLINRFGGMRPMSRKVDVPVSTIQGWKKRDHIPSDRVPEIVTAARANQISLDEFYVTGNANENTQPTPSVTAARPAQTADPLRSPVAPRTHTPQSDHYKSQHYSLDAKAIKRAAVRRSVITTVSILAIVGGVGWVLFGNEAKEIATVAKDQQQIETRMNSFETTITNGINDLSSKVSTMANAVGLNQNAQGQYVSPNDIPLTQMVGNLTNRFENITTALDGQGDTEQAFIDLKSIVDTLQNRIESLDASLEQAKAENEDIARSMQGVNGRDLSAAAMLLALTQMRDSLNRSEPFAQDLQILQELVGEDDPELTAAINRLAPYAENGVLTPEGLSNELRGVTGEIVTAALRGEDVSVQDKIMARIGQILSVEKNGEPILGIEEQAIVARAQAALDRGDTKTALAELNKLEGEAASAANPVTDKLMGTINADETITQIMQTLVKKLQSPAEVRSMIQSIPDQIERQMQGEVLHDPESGIIILEQ